MSQKNENKEGDLDFLFSHLGISYSLIKKNIVFSEEDQLLQTQCINIIKQNSNLLSKNNRNTFLIAKNLKKVSVPDENYHKEQYKSFVMTIVFNFIITKQIFSAYDYLFYYKKDTFCVLYRKPCFFGFFLLMSIGAYKYFYPKVLGKEMDEKYAFLLSLHNKNIKNL